MSRDAWGGRDAELGGPSHTEQHHQAQPGHGASGLGQRQCLQRTQEMADEDAILHIMQREAHAFPCSWNI